MPTSAARCRRAAGSAARRSICGDLVVDVPPESQVHRQVVRKRAETHPIEIDPVVRLHYVEVARARHARPLQRPAAAADRRCARNGASARPRADLAVLHGLQKTLRAGDWKVTVAVRKGREIVAVLPGFRDRAFGVAFDIGSTTIAAHLCDLATGEVARLRAAR